MLPEPGGTNAICSLSFSLPCYQSSRNKEHFLEVPKGPEQSQIWKDDFLMGTMLPAKAELTGIWRSVMQ